MADTRTGGAATPALVTSPPLWVLVVALHEDRRLVGAKAPFHSGTKVELGRGFERFTVQERIEGPKGKYRRAPAPVLADPRISETHARLQLDEESARLWNLSKNGTLVNGAPSAPGQALSDGDTLTIGPCVLLLRRTRWMDREPDHDVIVGRSAAIEDLLRDIALAAGRAALIRGEMGAGKELVADALYRESGRKKLKQVNCALLRSQLSELSGHVKGAFSGADEDRKGILEEAHEGTLFLDEVADLEPRAQAQLLRFLEKGEVQRVGSAAVKHVDVHVIAASNADFERRIAEETFRADLYYRLCKTEIVVPPLRDRREDIPLLFYRFLDIARAADVPVSRSLMAALLRHDWPGNVRELRSAVEHLVVAARKAHEQDPKTPLQLRMTEALQKHLSPGSRAAAAIPSLPPAAPSAKSAPSERAAPPSKDELVEGSRKAGSMRAYAEQLGVSRSTLYRWFQAEDLDPREVAPNRKR